MRVALGKLEAVIGHKFKNLELLERAVTHRSWAYENLPGETEEKLRESENESMEFIGDSVLGLVIAHEVGHLLLPHGDHSSSGIMQVAFDLSVRWPQRFTREEAAHIRAALIARQQTIRDSSWLVRSNNLGAKRER